jgi:hypothetical protein
LKRTKNGELTGKPVIGTPNGEIDEMIKVGDDYAGFIIPIIDGSPSIEETIKVSCQIFQDPSIVEKNHIWQLRLQRNIWLKIL